MGAKLGPLDSDLILLSKKQGARSAGLGSAMRAKKKNIGSGNSDFAFLRTTQLDALMLF